MPLDVGTVFAGYTIVRLVGSGGMGEVYLAQHPRLPRHDALKILRADVSDDGEFRERFIQEADLAASLSHPNIIKVHDRGECDGQLWIATEYIDGTDAAQLMRDRYPSGMPVEDACAIVTAIAQALDYAHDRGLLHRDVKPANILLSQPNRDSQRQIYLADFGIARPLSDPNGLTATNLTVGTVAYAAPEQLMGEDLDGRADEYALAATAYHLLTGAPLYENTNPVAVISRHLSAPAPPVSDRRPDLSPLDKVLNTALAKNPAERFDSCTRFAKALSTQAGTSPTSVYTPHAAPTIAAPSHIERGPGQSTQATHRPRRRPLLIALAAIVAVIALVGAGLLFIQGRPEPAAVDRPTSAGAPTTAGNGQPDPPTGSPSVINPSPAATATGYPKNVEVSFIQIGADLEVRFRNPNQDVGLVRSPFELALLDDTGVIISTEGLGGLPGAPVNTIYQLPPGGEFGLSGVDVPPGKTVASVELTVIGRWLQWGTVNPPLVAVTDAALLPDPGYSGPDTTGRITLDKGGPLNVVIKAFVKTPRGTVVSDVTLDCVQTGQRRSFETSSFTDVRGPYELESIVAYTTSVEGAGPQYTPSNC
jgi:serine/threonine protein kinase